MIKQQKNNFDRDSERVLIISDTILARELKCDMHSLAGREFGVICFKDLRELSNELLDTLELSLEIV